MERLLLTFLVIGKAISFLHALPYQEINLEDVDNSKKNYSIIILLEDELENSGEKVPKKSGRTIHETAWSKESKDGERNIVAKEIDQTNSTKSTHSWDVSQLLKSILNLVHNQEEEETDESVKKGKDNGQSKNISKKSKFHKPTSEISKSEKSVQKNHSYSNFESNSYTKYPFAQPSAQMKSSTNSSKNKITAKTVKSNYIDTFSSLKVDNEAFLENQYLNDESTIKKSESKESAEEKYYYDDDDYNDGEYCDYYSSSNSSEKSAMSKLISINKAEDGYEIGGVEVSDEEYLKLNSETSQEQTLEIPISNDSFSSTNSDESKIQKTIDQSQEESLEAKTLSKEMSTSAEKATRKKILKQYPMPNIGHNETQHEDSLTQHKSTFPEQPLTANELPTKEERHPSETLQTSSYIKGTESKTTEEDNELDILSSFRRSELNRSNIKNIFQGENITLTSKDDRIVSQEPEAIHVTNSYKPLIKTTVPQEVIDQPLTSNQIHIQSTTPSIPDVTDYYTKHIKFQSEMQNEIKQETPSNTLRTQRDPISKQNEDFLATKSTDSSETHKHVQKNSEFQAQNYSMNNQETYQELILSLPLSSSGEYISNISEKGQQLSNISEKDQQLSNTSEKDQQLSNTSGNNQQLSNTSEKEQQLSNTSEKNRKLSNISEKDFELSNTSEKDRQLSDSSESNVILSNKSERNQQLSNTFEKDEQIVLLETDSKNSNLELSNLQYEFVKNGQKKNQLKDSSSSYIHTSLTENQEQVDEASHIVNNTNFITPQANLNANQKGEYLSVEEVSKRFSGMSVTNDISSKLLEENENEEDYYEFDVGNSVKSVSGKNQISKSVETSPTTKESDQHNIIQPSEPEKPYNTILEFLYKHSNNSLIQSLKEY